MFRVLIFISFIVICFNFKIIEYDGFSIYLSFITSLIILIIGSLFGFKNKTQLIFYILLILYGVIIGSDVQSLSYGLTLIIFVLFSFIKIPVKDFEYVIQLFVATLLVSDIRVLLESDVVLNTLNTSNRLESDFCGGINNLAYFNVFGLILVQSFRSSINRIPFQLFFLLFIVLTLSRGALIVTLCYMIFSFTIKQLVGFTLLLVATATYFFEYISGFLDVLSNRYVLIELSERAGRSDIWLSAIDQLFEIQAIIGYGLGNFEHNYLGDINVSIHNQYLDFIYVYGWLWFVIILIFMPFRLRSRFRPKHISWLGYAFFLSLLFDSRVYVIQTVLWSSLLFNLYLNWPHGRESLHIYN